MRHIANNLKRLKEQIGLAASQVHRSTEEVTLVAVSKGRSIEEIREAYACGLRDFAESRIQEFLEKKPQLPTDINWHFVGNLQKNKVQKALGHFVLIHSVDSVELAEKISKLSLATGIKTSVLIEANTSGEETKSGLSPKEWEMKTKVFDFQGIEIKGLMTMAPLTENEIEIKHCFSKLKQLQQHLEKSAGKDLAILSMGMSRDFILAIHEGATIVRIGTALFYQHDKYI